MFILARASWCIELRLSLSDFSSGSSVEEQHKVILFIDILSVQTLVVWFFVIRIRHLVYLLDKHLFLRASYSPFTNQPYQMVPHIALLPTCVGFGIVIVIVSTFYIIIDSLYSFKAWPIACWSQAFNDCPCSSDLISFYRGRLYSFYALLCSFCSSPVFEIFLFYSPLKPSPLLNHLLTYSNFTLQIIRVAIRSSTICLTTSSFWI